MINLSGKMVATIERNTLEFKTAKGTIPSEEYKCYYSL